MVGRETLFFSSRTDRYGSSRIMLIGITMLIGPGPKSLMTDADITLEFRIRTDQSGWRRCGRPRLKSSPTVKRWFFNLFGVGSQPQPPELPTASPKIKQA